MGGEQMGDAGFTRVARRTLASGSLPAFGRADSLETNPGNLRLHPCEDHTSTIMKLIYLNFYREGKKWAMQDLNLRLLPCEDSTLATELIAQYLIINHNSSEVKTHDLNEAGIEAKTKGVLLYGCMGAWMNECMDA
jgi:hypothetical protein